MYDQPSLSSINVNSRHLISSAPYDDEPSILGTLSTLHDPLWYCDNGTSHHLTLDITNLSIHVHM